MWSRFNRIREDHDRDVRSFLATLRDRLYDERGFLGKAMVWQSPRVIPFVIPENAGAVDSVLIAAADCQLELVYAAESHITAGSDGSAVSLDVLKASSGTAVTGGTSLLASTFDLKSTVNTPVIKKVANGGLAARPTRYINSGQQVGLNFAGTLTAYVGGALTLVFIPVTRPSW
jgi:hypothetical protein